MLREAAYWFRRRRLVKKCGEEKVLIAEMRSHFHAFGYDTSHMTDQELKVGVIRIGEAFARSGVTVEQAAQGLRSITVALQNVADKG